MNKKRRKKIIREQNTASETKPKEKEKVERGKEKMQGKKRERERERRGGAQMSTPRKPNKGKIKKSKIKKI